MKRESVAQVSSRIDPYRCRARLVWANERVVEPHFMDASLSIGEHTVCWLVERGTVRVEQGEQVLTAKAGEWLFLGAKDGLQHFSPRSRVISIRFELQWLTGEGVFLRPGSRILPAREHPELEAAVRPVVRLIRAWGDAGSLVVARGRIPLGDNYEIEAAFHGWLAVYIRTMEAAGAGMRQPDDYDARVAAAVQMIAQHPMEEKFEVGALARRCGLSTNQLGRLFKKQTGSSPLEYYERHRLELARHALSDTTLPIKEIAYSLGFGSSSHFTNWFNGREKVGPRAFRRAGP